MERTGGRQGEKGRKKRWELKKGRKLFRVKERHSSEDREEHKNRERKGHSNPRIKERTQQGKKSI
jgi:hypothetical protein